MADSVAEGTAPGLSPLILACLAATWLIWGSTYLAIKWALISLPPFFQMGTRFLVAGAFPMGGVRPPGAGGWGPGSGVGPARLWGAMTALGGTGSAPAAPAALAPPAAGRVI